MSNSDISDKAVLVHPRASAPPKTQKSSNIMICLPFRRIFAPQVHEPLCTHFPQCVLYLYIPRQRIRGFVWRKNVYRRFRSPQFFHPVCSLVWIVRIEFVEPGFHAGLEVSQKVVGVPQGRIRVFVITSVQMVRLILDLWRGLQGGFLHLISIQQSRTGSC